MRKARHVVCAATRSVAGKNKANATQEVIDQLNAWPKSTAYLPEKYVLDFLDPASMVDLAKVGAATGMNILHKHVGYSWPEIANTVAQLKRDNEQSEMKIPGLCMGFNDAGKLLPTGMRDYSQSVWGGGPARVNRSSGGEFLDRSGQRHAYRSKVCCRRLVERLRRRYWHRVHASGIQRN